MSDPSPGLVLVIGNKNTSSWSLRPWLALTAAGIAFEERMIRLDRPESRAGIAAVSPGGTVPVLLVDGVPVWESLAIIELAAELAPGLWPEDRLTRAVARAVAAEMHSGFAELRGRCPMAIASRTPADRPLAEPLARDIDRVRAIWRDCRGRFASGGPFLFGRFSAADAMYAPVVTRFRTYDLPRGTVEDAYIDAVMAHPAMRDWCEAALAEAAS